LKYVSKISIQTDDQTGAFQGASSQLIALDLEQTGEDPMIKDFVETLREPGVDEILGTAQAVFYKKPTQPGCLDSSLNNWVADLLQKYAQTTIAIHNNGGTRADMPQGPITLRHLIDIVPYDDTITRVKVSGAFLQQFIKEGLYPHNLFSYAGLQITFQKDAAGRIQSLTVRVNGQPLDLQKEYEIVTNTYLAEGNGEGVLFKQIPASSKQQVGQLTFRDLMAQALRQGPVTPPDTGRMQEGNQ